MCDCGNRIPNKGKLWTYAKHFAPVDDLGTVIKQLETIEDYEMCGKLLKIMQENQ
jgi:hypothetical protein